MRPSNEMCEIPRGEREMSVRFANVASARTESLSILGDDHGHLSAASEDLPQVAKLFGRTVQHHHNDRPYRVRQCPEQIHYVGEALAA
ncbi:MAG: hypothetical protein JWL84_145 [Rhodospirillales bacterium]|nr:hypothetical protein [Rhodospirillales bacterium]